MVYSFKKDFYANMFTSLWAMHCFKSSLYEFCPSYSDLNIDKLGLYKWQWHIICHLIRSHDTNIQINLYSNSNEQSLEVFWHIDRIESMLMSTKFRNVMTIESILTSGASFDISFENDMIWVICIDLIN